MTLTTLTTRRSKLYNIRQGISPTDVERAWQESIVATDLYEIATVNRMPADTIQQRREDMVQATNAAAKLQELYWEQEVE